MRGSLLVTLDEIVPSLEIDEYLIVKINDTIVRKIQTIEITNLWSYKLNLNDVVTIELVNSATSLKFDSYDVVRIDYTTDDVYGDNGVKETLITNSVVNATGSTISFTATTRPDAYGFEYRVSARSCDFQIGTGFTSTALAGPSVREIKYNNSLIYVGGTFQKYSGITSNSFIVLNDDGTIYSGFPLNQFAGSGQFISSIEFQSDSKILVGGQFTSYSGITAYDLIRLNSDFTVDSTFQNQGLSSSAGVYDIEVQSDGKILIGGFFTIYSGVTTGPLCRINSNGTLDNTFTTNISTSYVVDIDLYNDGKIVVCGPIQEDTYNNLYVVRLNSNGSTDNTFTSPFIVGASGSPVRVEILSSGKILVAGYGMKTSNGEYQMLRLNSNGSVDTTFNLGVDMERILDFYVLSSGKILIIGDGVNGGVYRLNSDGSLDTTFNSSLFNYETITGLPVVQEAIQVKPNNKILIGGRFDEVNGYYAGRFAQLNEEGYFENC